MRAAISDGADVILQGSSSAVAGQVTEDVRKYNLRNAGNEVLYINLGGEAMELTGEKCHYYHFRTSPNAAIRVNTLADGMKGAGVLGDRVYAINQNYSWGVVVKFICLITFLIGTVVSRSYWTVESISAKVNGNVTKRRQLCCLLVAQRRGVLCEGP